MQNKKRSIITLILIILIIISVIGCGKKEPEISGIWKLVSEDKNGRMEIYSDGTGITSLINEDGDSEEYDFSWVMENGRFKITMDFGILGSMSESAEYELSESTLTLQYDSGTTERYNRIISKEIDFTALDDSDAEVSSPAPTATPEPEIITFECMDEIKNASVEDGLMQIYDMLFQYGATVGETIEIIENSQNSFEYYNEYNENQLILSGEFSEQIIFTKNNEWHFQFEAHNYSDETIPLKDCIVTSISAERGSQGNAFLGGCDDSEPLIYNDVKNTLMKDYEVHESTSYHGGDKEIIMRYKLAPNNMNVPDTLWITFFVDSETGDVIKIAFDSIRMEY